jgi:polysaccharide export outer membrane protein
MDSFLDPSVTGRWEKTPTIMPVLDRLSAIEDEPAEYVQTSPIVPADLVPEVEQYRLAPGDQVEVRIRDFFNLGQEEVFPRVVDQRGYVDLPRLGSIRAQGRTNQELVQAVEQAVRERQINERPVVSVQLQSQRRQTFTVMGAVQTPGLFIIPEADYRLLSGLTSAGSFSETIPYIYVIRQVPLTPEAAGRVTEPEPTRRTRQGRPPTDVRTPPPQDKNEPSGEDLQKLIDELSKPANRPGGGGAGGDGAGGGGSPTVMAQPGAAPGTPPVKRNEPAIDLPDSTQTRPVQPVAPVQPSSGGAGGWVYVDGKWVKAGGDQPGGQPAGTEQNLVTQRVIKVPTAPLLAGDASVNIVLRPGDVVRVPAPRGGQVYLGGQVQRPGAYNLPYDGKLTLLRALDSAGGLTGIAIPERIDVMRMVGPDRQATIRVDGRAIAEQTQPDLFLKPDDRINVGTSFWATPLAVFRGGLRASYGFGFILDRNFQGEVFGPDKASAPRF